LRKAARPITARFSNPTAAFGGMGYNFFGTPGDGFTNNNSLIPEHIFPSPQPVLSSALSSKTNLQFNATCRFGGKFYLLASTNITLPSNQWKPIRTNSITARGSNDFSVTLTNAVNQGSQQFYILQSQ
jgi:hypothetical protein